MDVLLVTRRDLPTLIYIGAVDGEACDGAADGVAQGLAGEVARAAIATGKFFQNVCEHAHFTGERRVHDELLVVIDERVHVRHGAHKTMVEVGERTLVSPLYKDAIHQVDEVISGGTVYRPLGRQMFTRLQDLFHQGEQGSMIR